MDITNPPWIPRHLAKASKAARRACLRAALNKEARLVAVAAVVSAHGNDRKVTWRLVHVGFCSG